MINIANFDLNLLKIFIILMEERSVSRTAERVFLTQPSVSHALNRLRDLLGDPLLVRGSRGMVPTPRATEIYPSIKDYLVGIDSILSKGEHLDIKAVQREIRILGTDVFEQLLLPKIVPTLASEAPLLDIRCTNSPGFLPTTELEKGSLDLAIAAFFEELPESFYKQELYKEKFVGLARKGHPLIKKCSLKEFVEHPHVVLAPKGNENNQVDIILAKKKLKRRVAITIANLMSGGKLLRDNDYIMVCPGRIAQHYKEQYKLEIFELPIKLPEFSIVQVWHARIHTDPVFKWFRRLLKEKLESH